MKSIIAAALCVATAVGAFCSEPFKLDFSQAVPGSRPKSFSSFVGSWYAAKEKNGNIVYVVDGRKWSRGSLSAGVADKAKALYGDRYAEFLDNIAAYKYFPLAICKSVENFESGTISVRFKTISGRIDQAAGIAFDIKRNGDYLVVRANSLENNIVAFRLRGGRRSVVKWVRNIPVPSKRWQTLKLVIKNGVVRGFLDGERRLEFKTAEKISGKIGLWSKADSYVLFDDFQVNTN